MSDGSNTSRQTRLNIDGQQRMNSAIVEVVAKQGTNNGGLDEDHAESLDVIDDILAVV
jgi:hypothetical protein